METNVDLVNLISLNELATAASPAPDDWLYWEKDGVQLGRKISIETVGTIIATQIGTAINRPDRVYQPGVDMPAGSSVVNDGGGQPSIIEDPYLDGLDYSVHLRGIEYMVKGQEWQNDVAGGGFRWTNGQIFEEGQIITVSFKPQISSVISTPDAVARFLDASGISLVTATSTLTAGSDRKLIYIAAASAVAPTITLNSAYPEGVLCAILCADGLQKNTIIAAPGGQSIVFNGTKTSFVLGQAEWAYLVRLGSVWYVTSISDNWQRVGDIVFGGVPGANKIAANGQTLQRNESPRLDLYLDALNAALPGSVISVGAWATDNTKWGRDATTIRVPKLGGWFPRFLDLGNGKDPGRTGGAQNIAGSTESMDIQEHDHSMGQVAGTGAIAGSFIVTGGGTPFPEKFTENEGGDETRPENVGLPALIYI